MRQRRRKCESVEHLRNTRLLHISIPILTPVSCCKGSPQSIGDDVWLDRLLEENLVMSIINVLLQNLGHHISEIPEQLSKAIAKQ
jgi:hypothetical protein